MASAGADVTGVMRLLSAAPTRAGGGRDDRGDIVVGWLTRIVVVLAVVGVIAFDALSVAAGAVGTADDADTAALAARDTWEQTHDVQQAYNAAVESLSDKADDTVLANSFAIDDKGTVRLKVRRTVTTLVLHRIGPLRDLAVVVESGSASPSV